MYKEDIDFSFHCEHCQSFPDRYLCMVTKKECPWIYEYNVDWEKHPCKNFIGHIKEYYHSKRFGLRIYDRQVFETNGQFFGFPIEIGDKHGK